MKRISICWEYLDGQMEPALRRDGPLSTGFDPSTIDEATWKKFLVAKAEYDEAVKLVRKRERPE